MGVMVAYDSVTWQAIPDTAQVVLLYMDGRYAAPPEAFTHFAGLGAIVKRISVEADDTADAFDIENGNAPATVVFPRAVLPRLGRGQRSLCYSNKTTYLTEVEPASVAAGVPSSGWDAWIADPTGQYHAPDLSVFPNAVMCQYGWPPETTGNYDLSYVAPSYLSPLPKEPQMLTTRLDSPPVAEWHTPGGYLVVTAKGTVYALGAARHYGDMTGHPLNAPIVHAVPTLTDRGYLMAGADGGVFAFGDAIFCGSQAGSPLNAPVARIALSPTGRGYTLGATDGGVFTFGDAPFYGSLV